MVESSKKNHWSWITAEEIRSGFLPPNLRFLRRYRPQIVDQVSAALTSGEALYGYSTGRAGIGAIRYRAGDSWSLWTEYEQSPVSALSESAKSALQNADLLYLIRLGLGTVARSAFQKTRGRNKGIVIVEPSPEFLLAAMASGDLRDVLSSGQVFIAVGQTWENQLYEIIDQHHLTAAAAAAVRPAIEPAGYWGEHVFPLVVAQIRQIVAQLQPQLQRRLDRYIQSRKGPSYRPGRTIWAFQDSRGVASYSLIQTVLLRTLFYHLRRLGWIVRYTRLRDGCYYPNYYRIWEMARAQPDILFFCNEAPAFEFVLGSQLARSLRVPKVVWHADDPFYCQHLYLRHGMREDEFYLAADYGWLEQLRKYGARNRLGFMPGGATVNRPGKRSKEKAHPIVFVGQIRDSSKFFARIPSAQRDFCEAVIQDKIANPRVSLATIMSRYPFPGGQPGEDVMDEIRQKILWEANSRHRLNVAKELEDVGLVIYGNSAWLKRLPSGPNRDQFRGTIPFKKLPLLYRNALVTLNIHSLQTYTCLNVRDFDVPASGGFLLSDWVPRVEEFFRPALADDLPPRSDSDEEIFLYRNVGELRRVAEFFIEHPDARIPFIERARSRVLRDHTYARRAAALSQLFERLIERKSE